MEMPEASYFYLDSSLYKKDSINGNRMSFNNIIQEYSSFYYTHFKNLTVYKISSNEKTEYYFLDLSKKIYVGNFIIKKDYRTKFPRLDSIWKYKNYDKDTGSDILLNFILTEFSSIESSSIHSKQAQNFWIKTLHLAQSKGYKISFVNVSTNTENSVQNAQELENWIKHAWNNSDVVPRIYAK